MSGWRKSGRFLLVLLLGAGASHAQSLSEAAARERERREAQAKLQGTKGGATATAPAPVGGPVGLGIQERALTAALRQKTGLPAALDGRYLFAVFKESPALRGGLRVGDVLLRLDGQGLAGEEALALLLHLHAPADALAFDVWRQGRETKVTVVREPRMAYLNRGCDLDDGYACNDLAALYRTADGVPTDVAKNLAFLEKGCRLRAGPSCERLASAYENGEGGVAQDVPRARKYRVQGCEFAWSESCLGLGLMMQDSEGGPQDYPGALSAYTRACDDDYFPACVNLGLMYVYGQGAPANREKAKAILTRACSAGLGRACQVLDVKHLR